jgi:UDP-GlcNAc:undecaprenyl-phosphate GlcNAc-1-phosphate transferase
MSIIYTLLAALALSALVTPVVRRFARKRGVLARPTQDRWHRAPVALLGGYAIAISFLFVVGLRGTVAVTWPLLVGPGLMFALGALDDVFRLRPATKLVAQMTIAAIMIALAPAVHITGTLIVDSLLTFTWIVGITNAFNLLDNIDGLSAGTAAIAGLFYLAVLAPAGASPLAHVVAALVGAALGFLFFNFHPASIFMGDSGSLFLGSMLAATAIFAAPGLNSAVVPVTAIPLLILLIPIFDTAFVTVTRPMAGRSPMLGGRDHLSHRLVALGIAERRAVLALYALAALGGAIALSLQHVHVGYAVLFVGAYVIVLASIGIVLGHVEAHAPPNAAATAPLISDVAYRNRIYEVVLDSALISLAYYGAFRLRFSGPEFEHFVRYFAESFPIVLACQLAGLSLAGKYRQMWRAFGARELANILKGISFGVAGSILVVLFLYRFEGFSRLVFVVDAVLLSFLLVGARVAIATMDEYLRKQRSQGRAVLIYGAGRGGTLLLRELLQNGDLGLMPVGFLDDDPAKRRNRIEGVPVLGTHEDLTAVAEAHKITEVIISIRDLDRGRLGSIARRARAAGVAVRTMRFALEEIGPVPYVSHDSQAS